MVIKRILIVDDDEDDKELFCEAIRFVLDKSQCDTASNGAEGMQHVFTPPPYDLIFLDINMPVMNGYDMLKKLKADQLYKEIPVIMISTSRSLADKEMSKHLGAMNYFSKPSSFSGLVKGLKEILADA